jgi:REP element-mobilizing transposase RayT
VVNREKVLQRAEKEEFVRLMRLYERFCGVRVLTFCVMSNHFHLLVEVPPRPEGGLEEEEFLIYSERKLDELRGQLAQRRAVGDEEGIAELKERYQRRMWDLGSFMQSVKQCFTTWFNRRHNRRGTLWEERYRNVLVEDGQAARVMAGYIDLNPVRAGMVKRPEDYRWCGYAEAVAGGSAARAGLERVMTTYERMRGGAAPTYDRAKFMEEYRMILFFDGEERERENAATGRAEIAQPGFSAKEVARVLQSGGKLSRVQMLRCRMRAFTDGTVLGSSRFVNDCFEAMRDQFGPNRKDGARPLRGCETDLSCLREIREE